MEPVVPLPEDEQGRLACLRSYGILDTPPNESFDRITRLAARLLNVPIAMISLVDEDRQWVKSRIGVTAFEFPRKLGFSAYAICQDETFVVADARRDPRFRDGPFVARAPHVVSYLGAPLKSPDGYNIGTICAIDVNARSFSNADRALGEDLAAAAMDLIESHQFAIRANTAEQILTDAVEALPDGFVLYDAEDRLVFCNRRYRELYAETADLIESGKRFEDLLRNGIERGQYPEAAGNEEAWLTERLYRHRNPAGYMEQELPGERWLRIQERRTAHGGTVGFRIDITELKRNQRALTELAWTDALTKALTRHRFTELAGIEMERMRRESKKACVLAIDIDHFKLVNDTFGHAAGDKVLAGLVARWKKSLRPYDLLGRLGGEEFVALLPDTSSSAARRIAERIRRVTAADPIKFEGREIATTTSVGISAFHPAEETVEQAIARADKALYAAKHRGRNRVSMKAA